MLMTTMVNPDEDGCSTGSSDDGGDDDHHLDGDGYDYEDNFEWNQLLADLLDVCHFRKYL